MSLEPIREAQEYWEWVAYPQPDLSGPGIKQGVSCLEGRIFYQLSYQMPPSIYTWL